MSNLNESNKTVEELNSAKKELTEIIEKYLNSTLHDFKRARGLDVSNIQITLDHETSQHVFPAKIAKVKIDFGINL